MVKELDCSWYYVFLAWIFACAACNPAYREEAGTGIRITFEVDSIRVYHLGYLSEPRFVFSPVGEPNAIWIRNALKPFVLHLHSGQKDTLPQQHVDILPQLDGVPAGTPQQQQRSTFELLLPCIHCASVQDDSITWIFNGNQLYFSTSPSTYNARILRHPLPLTGSFKQALFDSKYLYVLFDQSFAIINRDFLLRNGRIYDYNERQRYFSILSDYRQYANAPQQAISGFIRHTDSIRAVFLRAEDEEIRQLAASVAHSFTWSVFTRYSLPEIEAMLLENELPDPYRTPALVELTGHSVLRVDLQKALYYQSLIRTDPDSVRWGFSDGIKCVREVDARFEQLAGMSLPEDEKLYRRAEIKKDLLQCGWFGETGYDYTIVHRTYDSLLRFFPESEWADNATFALRQFWMYDEGNLVFSGRALNGMRKFIADYPQSELLADAHFHIVDLYSNYYHDEPNTQYKYLIRGLEELRHMKSLFNQIDTSEEYRQRLHYLQERLSGTAFEVSSHPAKSIFAKGEDLQFQIRIKNRIADPVFFKAFREAPHFRTYFFSREKEAFQFVPGAGLPGQPATRTIKLLPGQEMEFSAAVNQAVRHGERDVAGKYVILKPARFYISFHSPDSKINTGQMAFSVE